MKVILFGKWGVYKRKMGHYMEKRNVWFVWSCSEDRKFDVKIGKREQ